MFSVGRMQIRHFCRFRQNGPFLARDKNPTVPEGHKTPAEPRRDPAEPSERPRRALGETPAEPSERQISSESLAEGCAPRLVTLRNFRKKHGLPKTRFVRPRPSGFRKESRQNSHDFLEVSIFFCQCPTPERTEAACKAPLL